METRRTSSIRRLIPSMSERSVLERRTGWIKHLHFNQAFPKLFLISPDARFR